MGIEPTTRCAVVGSPVTAPGVHSTNTSCDNFIFSTIMNSGAAKLMYKKDILKDTYTNGRFPTKLYYSNSRRKKHNNKNEQKQTTSMLSYCLLDLKRTM
ncbi:unnamed protein product [Spodoptera littoralis]|uniref:Uncharacterized protein n=1 Tax=Spodoptera littoralis TaxID=7109 RepID=A0A9P0NB13_SPOLI|nr:unnamed protein product [Spodoptera littoralis]